MPQLGAPELIIILVLLVPLILVVRVLGRRAPTTTVNLSNGNERGGLADQLQKLTKLRDSGALSNEEFDAAKRKLLH
jgi:hypothetical protein